jgi:tetratricopeptide (TPR) repeat protein
MQTGRGVRVTVGAAVTIAAVGAGAAAGTSAGGLAPAIGGGVGGVAGIVGAAMLDQALQRRGALGAARAERDESVLEPLVPIRTSSQGRWSEREVLGLLEATRCPTRFWGRRQQQDQLRQWCQDAHDHPVMLLTGVPGVGKRRLALHFAQSLPEGWASGWLAPRQGDRAVQVLRHCEQPTLVLVDEADTRADAQSLLETLASYRPDPLLRVLLITRAEHLFRRQITLDDRHRSAVDNARSLPLDPQGDTEDRVRWFGESVRAYAHALHTPPPDVPVTAARDAVAVGEPILLDQAAALLTVLDTERARPLRRTTVQAPVAAVAEGLLEHEARWWDVTAGRPDWGLGELSQIARRQAMAAVLLLRPPSEEAAVAVLRRVPGLTNAEDKLYNLARWIHELYPGGEQWAPQLRPELVADAFVVIQLINSPQLRQALLNELDHASAVAALNLLARAAEHSPAAADMFGQVLALNPAELAGSAVNLALTGNTARDRLDATIAGLLTPVNLTADALHRLNEQIPIGWLPRTEVVVAEKLVTGARADPAPERLASAVGHLAVTLDRVGRYQEALATHEEAGRLWRPLAAANPAVHTANLATAVGNLAVTLDRVGRYQEALATHEEAVRLWRPLAAANPAVHTANLATAVDNLATGLGRVGRHQEALAADEEAVRLWRPLAAANPAVHTAHLATAVDNLAVALGRVGRHQKAQAAREEALRLRR